MTRNGTLVKDGGVTVTGKTLVLARGKTVVQTKVDTLVKAMRDAKGTPVRFKFTAAVGTLCLFFDGSNKMTMRR